MECLPHLPRIHSYRLIIKQGYQSATAWGQVSSPTRKAELSFKKARLPQSRDMTNLTAAIGIGWPKFREEEDSYYTSTSCLCDLQLCFKLPPPLITPAKKPCSSIARP